jgi:hypothetical protein
MPTMSIDVDRARLARVRREIAAMRARARDVRPAWEALLDWFADRNFSQFLRRGGEYGTPWAPLKPETIEQKRRMGYPTDPEIRTGRMAHELTMRPLGVENLGPRSMEAGTKIKYARFQHRGTRRGLPARPLFSAEEIRASNAATNALANWVIDGRRSVAPRRRRT